ncbi:hypothetical protein BDZ89DRAFT_971820 [Hymenopellis radicata]|nr:hypothetical protein BDZ89DRAFT_971820 [Hymenopellis radicata]
MHDLVDNIITPYFEETKQELGLPKTQYSIWKIDCWSVHKSKDFMDWMHTHHPRIIVMFVPGNCTGVWQPLDVGMQRVMKLAIKCACHRDIVDEVACQLDIDADCAMKLDNSIGTLHNRSLGWIVAAIRDTSDCVLIQKVCHLLNVHMFSLTDSYRPLSSVQSTA